MAVVVLTLKVMPTGPETDMDKVFDSASQLVRDFVDEAHKEDEIIKEIEEI
jgi:translation elongation factor EF-1beta